MLYIAVHTSPRFAQYEITFWNDVATENLNLGSKYKNLYLNSRLTFRLLLSRENDDHAVCEDIQFVKTYSL